MRITLQLLLLFSLVTSVYAVVYSVDSTIDEDRMAVDKMYYDLYYNPRTKIFERGDLRPLSPTAIQLIEKARESKVDRAENAAEADRAQYTQQTGENTCIGDPYIGSGTDVQPEVQTMEKPGCLKGGANFVDENMGYVFLVDRAENAKNARTATAEVFRTDAFQNPVPRVYEAPSADKTYYMDQFIIHDDGNIRWDLAPCQKGDPSCVVVQDKSGPPKDPRTGRSKVDEALWANYATSVSKLGDIDPTKGLKVLRADWALEYHLGDTIERRNYTFAINHYTVTNENVMFCDPGWMTIGLPPFTYEYVGDTVSGSKCGGNYTCTTNTQTDCIEWDTAQDPPICKTTIYACTTDACINSDFSCRYTTGLTVSTQYGFGDAITINVGPFPGDDTRLEPENIRNNLDFLYSQLTAAAQRQLPSHVSFGKYKLTDVLKCDGTPSNPKNCLCKIDGQLEPCL